MGEVRLSTPWTAHVSPDNALPEYPRPQLRREDWQSLNGVWEFAAASADDGAPFGVTLDERVLVPYPIESALSGIQRHEDRMWYRRTFAVPNSWVDGAARRLRLHFGAVDYRATVWIDGVEVVQHRGGYGQFSADITDALSPSRTHELIVRVVDRTDATWQPIGKQRRVPDRDVFYEAASGIWQTVWLEPVPTTFVDRLDMVTDVDNSCLRLTVRTGGAPAASLSAQVVIRADDEEITRAKGPTDTPIDIPVPNPRLWSPESPFLYDVEVSLTDDTTELETVHSYVGMRQIAIASGKNGLNHVTLNGEPIFLLSTLDQGYWPDGIYTAPTDEALAFDLEETKRLGFNTVRKHLKTEPDRWYYHADRLGLMVWQDMPSMRLRGRPPPPARSQFEAELRELVDQKRCWTSIIGWVPFNEGWGEWSRMDTGRIADEIKAMDPTRLVNAHSGVNWGASKGDSGAGDVIDWHEYPGPTRPSPDGKRISIDGEHGGFGLQVPGHMWFGEGHAYQMADSKDDLTSRYVDNQRRVLAAAHEVGISGATYTQITDVEHEVNGFLTYDRRVEKMDFSRVRAVNESILREARSG
jgi:beta-galactosidase/beta-glucuronidase